MADKVPSKTATDEQSIEDFAIYFASLLPDEQKNLLAEAQKVKAETKNKKLEHFKNDELYPELVAMIESDYQAKIQKDIKLAITNLYTNIKKLAEQFNIEEPTKALSTTTKGKKASGTASKPDFIKGPIPKAFLEYCNEHEGEDLETVVEGWKTHKNNVKNQGVTYKMDRVKSALGIDEEDDE